MLSALSAVGELQEAITEAMKPQEEIKKRIQKLLQENPVMLFMKGEHWLFGTRWLILCVFLMLFAAEI